MRLGGHGQAREATAAATAHSCCQSEAAAVGVLQTIDAFKCFLGHFRFLP